MKILKHFYFLLGVTFIVVAFSGAYYADQASVNSNSFTTGESAPGDVVMNEIMPNPDGNDDALMPGGEWVELYNTGNWAINVQGWKLCSMNSRCMIITPDRLMASSIIPAGGYLVVYRSGSGDFELNDNIQTIILMNREGMKVDKAQYSGSEQGKSWAKKPDGTGGWVAGQTPTPGGTNGS